jgi:hypothetical protein
MPTVTVKMPKALHDRLETEAAKARTSKSAILRERFSAGSAAPVAASFFEKARQYIGVLDGPGDLSARSKKMKGYGHFRRP